MVCSLSATLRSAQQRLPTFANLVQDVDCGTRCLTAGSQRRFSIVQSHYEHDTMERVPATDRARLVNDGDRPELRTRLASLPAVPWRGLTFLDRHRHPPSLLR